MSGIGSPEERYEQAHPEATAKEADDGMQVSEGGGVAGVPEALDISRAVREICELTGNVPEDVLQIVIRPNRLDMKVARLNEHGSKHLEFRVKT